MSCAFALCSQVLMKNELLEFLPMIFISLCSWGVGPPFAPCHELTVTLLHDPKDFASLLYESSPSSTTYYNGVLGSSSSCSSVPS